MLDVHLKSTNCQFILKSMSPFCVFVTYWLSPLLISTYLSTVWAMILASVCCVHYFYITTFIVWTHFVMDSLGTSLSHLVMSLHFFPRSISLSACDLLKPQITQGPHTFYFLGDVLPVLLARYKAMSDSCHSFRDS